MAFSYTGLAYLFSFLAVGLLSYRFFQYWYGTVLTTIIPFNPYLEPSGGINWDVQPLADLFRFSTFLLVFIPLSIVLFIMIFITQKPPSQKEEKYTPSFSQIQW